MADGARRRHGRRQGLDAARRPRLLALRRAGPDPADDRPRLPGRAVTVRPANRRRPDAHRAIRVLRRRDGARERLHGDQRGRDAAGAVRPAVRAGRGRARRPRLRRGALVRDAADRRARLRDRPLRDAPHGQGVDPGRRALPCAAARLPSPHADEISTFGWSLGGPPRLPCGGASHRPRPRLAASAGRHRPGGDEPGRERGQANRRRTFVEAPHERDDRRWRRRQTMAAPAPSRAAASRSACGRMSP